MDATPSSAAQPGQTHAVFQSPATRPGTLDAGRWARGFSVKGGRLNSIRAAVKLARALLHILVGFFTILLVFPRFNEAQRQLRTQVWSLGMLRCIGIELIVKGNPALNGPLLLVANHM